MENTVLSCICMPIVRMCRRFLVCQGISTQPQLGTPCACNHARTKMLRRQFRPRHHPLKLIVFLCIYGTVCDCTLYNHNHNHTESYKNNIFFWSRCFPNKHIYGPCSLACNVPSIPYTEESKTNTLGSWVVVLRWWLQASYIYIHSQTHVLYGFQKCFGFSCDAEKFVSKLCLSLSE